MAETQAEMKAEIKERTAEVRKTFTETYGEAKNGDRIKVGDREFTIGKRLFRLTPLGQSEIPLYLVEVEVTRAFGAYVTVREVESKQIYHLAKDKIGTLYDSEEDVRAVGLKHFEEMRDRVKKAEKSFKETIAAIRSEGSEVKS